jgi:hypothetical protein
MLKADCRTRFPFFLTDGSFYSSFPRSGKELGFELKQKWSRKVNIETNVQVLSMPSITSTLSRIGKAAI